MAQMDISQIVYNYVFVLGGFGLVVWSIFKFGVHKAIEEHMVEIRNEFKPMMEDLRKIKYQVLNNGGESMKDAIDRIEKDLIVHMAEGRKSCNCP